MLITFEDVNEIARSKEQRSMDIDKFFDEMGIPEESKEKRKDFARQLENDLFVVLAFIFSVLENDVPDGIKTAKDMAETAVLNAINKYFVPDSTLVLYAENYANEFVDATVRNKGNIFDEIHKLDPQETMKKSNKGQQAQIKEPEEPGEPTAKGENEDFVPFFSLITGTYFFSEDRARLNAENEANSVFNYEELKEAKASGNKYKEWNTMGDERVRLTHAEVDGTIIPIDEAFSVGGYPMQYPRQIGAPAKEVVNCRCWLTYHKTL